jgi:hypothetical protein
MPHSASARKTVALFGLSIECQSAELPALPIVETAPDIRFVQVAEPIDHPPVSSDSFVYAEGANGTEYVRWVGVVEALVSRDGSEIMYRPLAGSTIDACATYLFGQALSFALIKRGIDPIHATVIVNGDRAIGFLGQPGSGKSTLAAGFLARGSKLLSDDMLVFRREGTRIYAQPGTPRLKLFPDVAKHVVPELTNGGTMNPVTSKMVLHLSDAQYVHQPVRLVALYVLDEGDNAIGIAPLRSRDAFVSLTENTFNLLVTQRDRMRRQVETAAALVGSIAVKSLSYRRDLGCLRDVVDSVLEDPAL